MRTTPSSSSNTAQIYVLEIMLTNITNVSMEYLMTINIKLRIRLKIITT